MMTIKSILFISMFTITGVANAASLNAVAPTQPQCVATDIGLALGLVNASGEGPALPIQVDPESNALVVKARLGQGRYFVSAMGTEVVIAAGSVQSVGTGATRILDVKNGIGLKCTLSVVGQ